MATMNPWQALFVYGLALWILVFGFAMILQRHRQFARWTGRTLRVTGRYVLRQFGRLCRWVWQHYRQYVLGFASGILATLYFLGYFR